MVRLLQIVSASLIVLVAVEGSVVQLAHSDHCLHRHAESTGSHAAPNMCLHLQAEDGTSPMWVAVRVVSDDDCLACSYLSQRTGAPSEAESIELWSPTATLCASTSRLDHIARIGTRRARAPPVDGLNRS